MKHKSAISLRNVDNVGKAFVAIQSQKSSKVFRISCELMEPVDGEVLNNALDKLVKQFSFFQVEIKNGLLWPYLIKSAKLPAATPYIAPECAQIYSKNRPGLLYEVAYRDKWIHLEVFHALTDGIGASYFLRMLVIAYLMVRDGQDVNSVSLPEMVGLSPSEYELDGYEANYVAPKFSYRRAGQGRAYQVSAQELQTNANREDRLVIDTKAALDVCHQKGITAAELLAAIYVKSFYDTMAQDSKKGTVSIAIPVNLRKMFGCMTARNFFAMIKTRHPVPTESYTLDSILEVVHKDFKENLQPDILRQNFSQFIAIERSLMRFVPLTLKTLALQFSDWLTAKNDTAILSNLGRMELPEEYARHVKAFDLMDKTDGIKLCVVSFGEEMSLHFTSGLDTSAVYNAFRDTISDLGIPLLTHDVEYEKERVLPHVGQMEQRRGLAQLAPAKG